MADSFMPSGRYSRLCHE